MSWDGCQHSAQDWYIDRKTGKRGCRECDGIARVFSERKATREEPIQMAIRVVKDLKPGDVVFLALEGASQEVLNETARLLGAELDPQIHVVVCNHTIKELVILSDEYRKAAVEGLSELSPDIPAKIREAVGSAESLRIEGRTQIGVRFTFELCPEPLEGRDPSEPWDGPLYGSEGGG